MQAVENRIPPAAAEGPGGLHLAPLHPELGTPEAAAPAAHMNPFAAMLPNADTIQGVQDMAQTGAHELVDMLRRGVHQGGHIMIQTHGGVIQITTPVAAWVLNHIPVLASAFAFALTQEAHAPQ